MKCFPAECRCAGCGRRWRELHGFMVKDVASLIEHDCARDPCQDGGGVGVAGSHVTAVDTARRYQLVYRCRYIEHSLRPFGYDFAFHPHFAARLVCIYYPSSNASIPIRDSNRFDSLCESIRIDSFRKKSAFRFTSCHAVFALNK